MKGYGALVLSMPDGRALVKIWEPHGPLQGAPGPPPREPPPPPQWATFENLFRRPCLLIVTDFKPFLEVPRDVFDFGKNLGTPGAPPGPSAQGGYL